VIDQLTDPHDRIEDLPGRFEQRLEDEIARGTARGRAAIVAFLDVATTELADWSPHAEGDDLLQCEIDASATEVVVGLIRSMAHHDSAACRPATLRVDRLVMRCAAVDDGLTLRIAGARWAGRPGA
jgi:hypothetical protein